MAGKLRNTGFREVVSEDASLYIRPLGNRTNSFNSANVAIKFVQHAGLRLPTCEEIFELLRDARRLDVLKGTAFWLANEGLGAVDGVTRTEMYVPDNKGGFVLGRGAPNVTVQVFPGNYRVSLQIFSDYEYVGTGKGTASYVDFHGHRFSLHADLRTDRLVIPDRLMATVALGVPQGFELRELRRGARPGS